MVAVMALVRIRRHCLGRRVLWRVWLLMLVLRKRVPICHPLRKGKRVTKTA